jgi:hypothetical protein
MGQQLLETAVFRKQGFRLGDHREKSPAADDDQLFSGPGHGDVEPGGTVQKFAGQVIRV